MLIFQHRNDAVRSQVVHLCCSNCRAFVASSQQLDFCQELDAWDLHTGPDHYCLLFPRETCPCRVVISEGPGELQFAVYMHATKIPPDFSIRGIGCTGPVKMTCGGPGIESRGSEILGLDDFTCSLASHSSFIIADCAGTWTDYQLQVLSMSSTHTLHQR